MKVVWITGASGFVGKNLLEQAPNDWAIYKIGRNDKAVELYDLPNPDIVIHLGASSSPASDRAIDDNLSYTTMIVEHLININAKCRFIYASTINVYGPLENTDSLACEITMASPTTAYAASKAMCEIMLYFYSLRFTNFKVNVLRFPGIVGKGMTHGLVKDVVTKLKRDNNNLLLLGQSPGTSKTYIHVKDACNAIKDCAEGKVNEFYTNVTYHWDKYRLNAEEASAIIATKIGLNPTTYFSGVSFQGDFSVPKIFCVNDGYRPKFNYKNSHEAFSEGVNDYLCAMS